MPGHGTYFAIDSDQGKVADQLAQNSFPETGNLVILLLPGTGTRLSRLAGEVLVHLGKRLDAHLTPQDGATLFEIAAAWVRAEQIEAIVLSGAEFLSAELIERAAELPTRVYFIFEARRPTEAEQRALATLGARERKPSELLSRETRRRPFPRARTWRYREQGVLALAPRDFPAVPTDAFPFFLASCEATLEAEDFERVRALYGEARELAERFCTETPEMDYLSAARFLHGLAGETRTVHAELTALRGAEEGFLRCGWLLKANPEAIAALGPPGPAPVTEAEIERLRYYANPRVAAIAALGLAGYTPREIAALDLDQVRVEPKTRQAYLGDGRDRENGGAQPESLYPFIDAHLIHFRGRLGYAKREPVFTTKRGERLRPRTIQNVLRKVAEETGLKVARHWTPPPDQRASHWMRSAGLSLQPL